MLSSQLEIVEQAKSFLSSISQFDYTTVIKPHFAGSAGAHMRHVLDHGARAFIPKTTEDGLFLSILRMVLQGGTYAPPALAGLGAGDVSAAAGLSSGGLDALTPRQRDVLEMLAQGLSNREVGERLGLNINTVKGHVTAILKVLGVENRTQAVLMLTEARR